MPACGKGSRGGCGTSRWPRTSSNTFCGICFKTLFKLKYEVTYIRLRGITCRPHPGLSLQGSKVAAWEGARAIDFHHTGNRENYTLPVATFLATTTSKPCHLLVNFVQEEATSGGF